jgi:hypothetical protein
MHGAMYAAMHGAMRACKYAHKLHVLSIGVKTQHAHGLIRILSSVAFLVVFLGLAHHGKAAPTRCMALAGPGTHAMHA